MVNSYVEPSNVGPIAGGNLRASDADRDKVTTLLTTAYAEGRITREEHDERLERVLAAKTFDELVPITSDLVLAPNARSYTTQPPATVDGGHDFSIDTANTHTEPDTMVGIFGGTTRKGKWRVRKQTRAYAFCGGIDLDLREATFEAPVVEINGLWCFGGLDIKVPEGIEVRDQTVGVFGGTDINHLGDPRPGAPVLVIKGLSLFGGVSVKGPKGDKKRKSHSCH
jgi:Domain of unknown function (DUF1707)